MSRACLEKNSYENVPKGDCWGNGGLVSFGFSIFLVAVIGTMIRKKFKKCERRSTKLTAHLI